jgi:hypothetical protein
MVELIRKKRYCGRKLMAVAVGAFGLLLVTGHPGPASETRTVPVTINTGESYVIQDVSKDSTPGVKVVSNPSALVVHTDAPGKVVLLGAAEGNWDIDVTLASGEKVIYAVQPLRRPRPRRQMPVPVRLTWPPPHLVVALQPPVPLPLRRLRPLRRSAPRQPRWPLRSRHPLPLRSL